MLQVKYFNAAVISIVIGAVAIRGQTCAQTEDGVATFPDDTRSIAAEAFRDCPELRSVTIPNTVLSIGDRAFRNSGIETVMFEADSQVESIGNEALADTNIQTIVIPASVRSIGDDAFFNSGLETVTFEAVSQVDSIGERAFARTNILTIVIPASVRSIGSAAFADSSIRNISILSPVIQLGANLFTNTCMRDETPEIGVIICDCERSNILSCPALLDIVTGTITRALQQTTPAPTSSSPPTTTPLTTSPPTLRPTTSPTTSPTPSPTAAPAPLPPTTSPPTSLPTTRPPTPPTTSPTGKPSPKPVMIQLKQGKKSKAGKLPKLAKIGKVGSKKNTFLYQQETSSAAAEPVRKVALTAGGVGSVSSDRTDSVSFVTLGSIPQNICTVHAGSDGTAGKIFNPVPGMCYDLRGNWWHQNIRRISGGGGAVCVDVWEGGYQVGRHQRNCAADWIRTEFDVSHVCCTDIYNEGDDELLSLTQNVEYEPTCGAQVDDMVFSPEIGMCYDLSGNWWDNKIQRIRGATGKACIDVWEGGFEEGRQQRRCGTDWVHVSFSVSHVCCTEISQEAVNPFYLTQNIEPAQLEPTAQEAVQSSDITCGAKVDAELFSPEIEMCYDLSGNWWDNKIQRIRGGGEHVCVDVWEGGLEEGRHQRQCGTHWAATSFPISHICCTEDSQEAVSLTQTEKSIVEESTAQAPVQSSDSTCGAKVDDKLFSPEVGKCYDLTGNWWDNKIQRISGGGAHVCVDVWEGGLEEGRHQRQCGATWAATSFPISHICCTDDSQEAVSLTQTEKSIVEESTAQAPVQSSDITCGAKVDDKLFIPEVGKCYDLNGNWWDNKIQLISGGGANVCVDVWEGGLEEGRHQRQCGANWAGTSFPISHICCTEESQEAVSLTQHEKSIGEESTAQAPVQSSDITCGAKMDAELFRPEVGKCYDLRGNWWDNKIQLISGGGEHVCVDVWEGGLEEGRHQRQCGAHWAATSFPVSHICCTEDSQEAVALTQTEKSIVEESTAQAPVQSSDSTCGAKVDDKLFIPEVGKCYDLSGNWWNNKIQMISGGGANVCVDVWEGGLEEGSHQRQCGDEWVNTYFSISHICCE